VAQVKYCNRCGSPRIESTIPLGDIGIRYACTDCGVVHYQNPNIVAGVIAAWEGRVLLCRRAIDPFRGLWTIPAGYLELGETVEEAARREATEEAGAMLGPLTLAMLYNLPMFGEVYLIYSGAPVSPAITAGPESTEVGFFAPDEIPWKSLAFPMVREALSRWTHTLGDPSRGIQQLDFLWGPEGAVRVRRYPGGVR
jgi:ADP-ribose pyrophosphatase YjhB (NUDIX family)